MPILDDLSISIMPLEYFRQVMGINPYHFWQMHSVLHPYISCSDVYTHYRWQGDRGPGRYDILQVLNHATANLAKLLNYQVGPDYIENEKVVLTQPRQVPVHGLPRTLCTKYQHIITIGRRTWTLISAAEAVTYTGEIVTLVVTVGTDVTADEVRVCYPGTTVPIEPAEVSIDPATHLATITLRRWMMGDPVDWESGIVIDADDANNLLQTLDVYQVWYDPTQQILLEWDGQEDLCGSGAPCTNSTQLACAMRGQYEIGAVIWQPISVAGTVISGASLLGWTYPQAAYINYLSGLIDDEQHMPVYWRNIVSKLAVTYLDSGLCGCDNIINAIAYWQEDKSRSSDKGNWMLSPSGVSSTLGTARGGLLAWEAVKNSIGE